MAKQLKRSPSDSMLGGVCGGLGEYFDADPNLIRLIFVVFGIVSSGVGILVYLALWMILPERNEESTQPIAERVKEGADEIAERARQFGQEIRATTRSSGRTTTFAGGLVLIAVGVVFLLRNFGITWFSWLTFGTLWPALLIVVGGAFLWRWLRGGE